MEQALEQVPAWAAGWFRLAEYAEKAGRKEAAAAALEKVVALDPSDIFGAGLKLAVLGVADTPAAPPTPYVERLFDDYADRFDTALVGKLDYTVPQTLARLVRRQGGWLVQLREIASTPAPGTADGQPLDADVFGLLLERAMEPPAERVRPGMDDHAH